VSTGFSLSRGEAGCERFGCNFEDGIIALQSHLPASNVHKDFEAGVGTIAQLPNCENLYISGFQAGNMEMSQ
jgi:hypothetical protein